MAPGEIATVLKEMLACGYSPSAEPFLAMMLQTFRASKLLDLRTKARIFIPKGRAMMGCLDETRTLEYGQVFVQYSRARLRKLYDHLQGGETDPRTLICKGKTVVTKNPCLHPGDVQILEAVDVPALHHMVDCIVFPQKGKRPHPNECSGSDLDGDVYFVSWDADLIPPQKFPPMDYTGAQATILDHDVTIEEVQEYFTDYLLNDSLGIICNAHVVFADREPLMARSEKCIELARLASIAVDFPKTGVPAKIPEDLRVKEYPDFMEKAEDKHATYVSEHVLGKLFRAVRDIPPDTGSRRSFTREVARRSYDSDMEVDGFKDYIEQAFNYKSQYDEKLGNLLDYYGIKTEAEIIGGFVMRTGKSFDKKRDLDSINFSVKFLKKQARAWFDESGTVESPDVLRRKASAWYHVTLIEIKKGKTPPVRRLNRIVSFELEIQE
ncbi:RNA-dependent RNA polymerase [Salix purpurea]|uniref:RNA-dependent RNA polymerase n=1 Tax=Salix purpurea TaxID=77065 RepID=A0A9Q0TWE3_SALPP|nr:RNA-dependent RNA polymerase [Salix purpurea]